MYLTALQARVGQGYLQQSCYGGIVQISSPTHLHMCIGINLSYILDAYSRGIESVGVAPYVLIEYRISCSSVQSMFCGSVNYVSFLFRTKARAQNPITTPMPMIPSLPNSRPMTIRNKGIPNSKYRNAPARGKETTPLSSWYAHSHQSLTFR